MDLKEAIRAYIERFDAGPPIYGLEEEDAIMAIEAALKTGNPMAQGADEDIPDDAYL